MALVRLLRRRGAAFYIFIGILASGVPVGARVSRTSTNRAETFADLDASAAEVVADAHPVGGGPFSPALSGLVEAIAALAFGLAKTGVAIGTAIPIWVPIVAVQAAVVIAFVSLLVVTISSYLLEVVK